MNAEFLHIGKDITKFSRLAVVLKPVLSPSVKRDRRLLTVKSDIKERESLAVMDAGLVVFTKRLFLVAMPTPPIPRFQAVPPLCRFPTP